MDFQGDRGFVAVLGLVYEALVKKIRLTTSNLRA